MIMSFFYWNRMEQNKKKTLHIEKKIEQPIIAQNPVIHYQTRIQPRHTIVEEDYQSRVQRKRQTDQFQTKPTSDDDDNRINFLQIGNQNKKRQKSQTQRWTSEEFRRNRRNRSEQRVTIAAPLEKFKEFDDLDKISDDKADLCMRSLPQNRLIKKMTL